MGFPSRCHSGRGPQLVLRGESPVFSRLPSCSSLVMTGTSGTRSWGRKEVWSPHQLRELLRVSSAVAAKAEVLILS